MSNMTNRIRHGDFIGVQTAIKGGASLDKQDKNKNTPLHIAVIEDRTEIACLLLQNGADPTKQNRAGKTPMELDTTAAKYVLHHVLNSKLPSNGLNCKKMKI